jgi:hypothetical protein
MFQVSSICKLPDKSRNLAARQAQVWAQMPHNVAGYNALANVIIENEYRAWAIDDNNGGGRFKGSGVCNADIYDPSMSYMYDYWAPTASAPVDQNQNRQDSRMMIIDQIDPTPRRLANAHSFMPNHRMSWQK